MTESTASRIVSIFSEKSFEKISDVKGFIPWKRKIRDTLKPFGLWKWVEEENRTKPVAPLGVEGAALKEYEERAKEWESGHDLTCTALRLGVTGNLYADIEHYTNAYDAFEKIKSNCTPDGSGYLTGAFAKLNDLTIAKCNTNPTTYVNKFREAVTEVENFSTHLRLDNNLLIWWFQSNLGSGYESYVDFYNQQHEPFKEDGSARHDLAYALNHFQNHFHSGVAIAAHAMVATTKSSPIRVQAQNGCKPGHTRDVIRTVKYCNICKQLNHDAEGHEDRPGRGGRGGGRGGRGGRGGNNSRGGDNQGGGNNPKDEDKDKDKDKKSKTKHETIEAYGNAAYYGNLAGVEGDLSTLFCLDTAATKHMINNHDTFLDLKMLFKSRRIINYGKEIKFIDIEII